MRILADIGGVFRFVGFAPKIGGGATGKMKRTEII
jgi:hypothetical protein